MGIRMLKVPFFQRDLVFYAMLLIFFYCNYYLLIEKFLLPKKHLQYLLIIVIIFPFIFYFSRIPVYLHHFEPHPPIPPDKFHHGRMMRIPVLREWLFTLFPYLTVCTLSIIIKYTGLWKKAEKERTEAELVYLKHQINPHFLFNTLNSIYSLSIQKSDQTSKAILKLSGMMRYFFEQGNQMQVSLDKEIQYIRDYIELQEIRLGNTAKIFFQVNGDLKGKNIASFVLLTFVENAFKYGINPEAESEIQIEINVTSEKTHFICINSVVNSGETLHDSKGVGIINTQKRLAFIYPSKHSLKIENKEGKFKVELIIFNA